MARSVDGLTITGVGRELLDDPAADPRTVEASLHDIARSNRWFGGAAAVRYGLDRVLRGAARGSRVSLLDLGTGLGDLPRAAVGWAARRGIRLVPVGVERHRAAAALAARAGLPTVLACAGAPPFGDKSVDVVLVSQVAHHLDAASVVRLFRTCDRLARRGVIVADLRRGVLGPVAFHLGARLLRFDRVTVADGVTSLRRGYTPRELARLLAEAGVRARVDRRPGYRLVATWYPEAA
jgi:SAM-dependent methyltransferase